MNSARLPVIVLSLAVAMPALAEGELDNEGIAQLQARARTPKNVLRAHLGATGGTGAVCPLLCDDPTVPLALPRGDYSVVYDLGDLHVINELAFTNEGCKGAFTVRVSTNRKDWQPAVEAYLLPENRRSTVAFVPSEARFVSLDFAVDSPGNVYGFGLFGLTIAADYQYEETFADSKDAQNIPSPSQNLTQSKEDGDSLDGNKVSLTITPNDAIVPWVSSQRDPSSAQAPLQLIDENSFTVCEFDPNDAQPTVRLDLSDSKKVRKVSVLYARQPGTLVLRLPSQSERNNEPAAESADTSENAEPQEFVFEDRIGVGKFSFERLNFFSRYVELQWTPETPPAEGSSAFSIGEIAVFSAGSQQLVQPRAVRAIVATGQAVGTSATLEASPEPAVAVVPSATIEPSPPNQSQQTNAATSFDLTLPAQSE